MATYTWSTSTSSSSFSSSSTNDVQRDLVDRGIRASSELSSLFYSSLGVDRDRITREFFTPQPIGWTGNYYPRYQVTGASQTGSPWVSYLSRPYLYYSVPSVYPGFSKFVSVRKL